MLNQLIRLANQRFELLISPTAGGSITRFDWNAGDQAFPILRSAPDDAHNVLDSSNFPLVPFVNRVRGGRFSFRGRKIVLTPNMASDPSPLHGQGWLGHWEIDSVDQTSAALSLHHGRGEWPWAYHARQEFQLDDEGLSVRLTCTNLSSEPMPCGLGQHPYFPCSAKTRLLTEVRHAWTIDENVLPVELVEAEGRFDLSDRLVCSQDLDHGFGGWGGSARITDPDLPFEVIMSSPDANFFQLYSPPQGGLFVAEPVTHANTAMNAPEEEWEALGFRVLEPGEAMTLNMRLEVRRSDRR